MEHLEDIVKQQNKVIEKQNEDLKSFKQQLEEKAEKLEEANVRIEDLSLKAEDHTDLKILFDDMCLVEIEHRKLYGDIPVDREDGTLTSIMGVWYHSSPLLNSTQGSAEHFILPCGSAA